jgi:hypothetical protein
LWSGTSRAAAEATGSGTTLPGYDWAGEADNRAGGFGFTPARLGRPSNWNVVFPRWLPAGLLAVMTWRAWRRVRKVTTVGRFGARGYDLRATPERCPECGTVPDICTRLNARRAGLVK